MSFNKEFDPWVDAQFPTLQDIDCFPCSFEFTFGEPFARINDNRVGMQLSQNCSEDLVRKIAFELIIPSIADSIYERHSDNSHVEDTCTVLNAGS